MAKPIWAWGNNSDGKLGDNTIDDKSSPISIARYGTYSAMSYGTHALAIDASDGSIWAWGKNTNGELGDNTTTDRSSPVSVVRTGSYKDVAAGNYHSLVIDASNGSVWAFGLNTYGQIGDNSVSPHSSPVSLCRAGSYKAVAVGQRHSLAIDASNGSIWAWGNNLTWATLGDNSMTSKSSPVSIARPGSYSAIVIGSNGFYSLAIDASNGSIWSWGANSSGELGNNSTLDIQSSPVSVVRPGSYSAIAGGTFHALAIDSSTGMIYAWGSNDKGQLGDNTIVNKSSPVAIALARSYIAISAGRDSSLAIDYLGKIWAWGDNSSGQLGNNTSGAGTEKSSPVSVAAVAGFFTKVGSGSNYSSFALKGQYISYFNQSSVLDGDTVLSTLDSTALISSIQSHYTDTYFDAVDEITKVVVYYNHEDGRQVRKIRFLAPSFSTNVSWTNYARDGAWTKNRIIAYNHEGATHDLPRSAIGSDEDISHAEAYMFLNT